MKTAAENTIEMETEMGTAQAIRDASTGIWDINTPWGGFRFFGPPQSVAAQMKRYIARAEKNERELNS